MTDLPRAVVLSGGYAHPFAETSAVVAGLAADAGLSPEIHESVGEALTALPGARLLLVNALWWSMLQDAKYAPHRAAYARNLADDELAAMVQHVAAGGGLVALHTATICWDTQPGWVALMGGGWAWGRSHHPPLGTVSVAVTAEGSALSGASDFGVIDEAYHALDPAPDCRILAHATAGGGPQPIAWTRTHEGGRVAVDALGHDVRSLTEPGHAMLLRAMIAWAAGGETDAQR